MMFLTMLQTILAVGTVWFVITTVATLMFVSWLISDDSENKDYHQRYSGQGYYYQDYGNGTGATITMIFFALFLQFAAGVNLWGSFFHRPIAVAVLFASYVAVGT